MAGKARKDESVGTELEQSALRTRHSLLGRLADWEDRESWQRFHDMYWRVIHSFARKFGLSDAEAFDVVQETIIDVAKQARTGAYNAKEGKFRSWLFRLVRWRVGDVVRQRGKLQQATSPPADATPRTSPAERLPDERAEVAWETEWKLAALATAMDRIKDQVNPLHFQIFECATVRDWPVKKVCVELGVNAAQVYLARHRVGALIKKEVEALERPAL